jgi:hypothetical protein
VHAEDALVEKRASVRAFRVAADDIICGRKQRQRGDYGEARPARHASAAMLGAGRKGRMTLGGPMGCDCM